MNNKYEEHECANCGCLMECTGSVNCWCLELTIPEEVQDFIAASFDGCLCRNCIAEMIEKIKN
ncbi:cysteine-rich CWC family protein [Sunxiuqinia elliptica]|uniref:Cysteine-rich CWC protein n=1 Tax=Sunxiuqinia elliptica TaxID=655355 RepID=A0A4R6GWH9_9BACT|nr:cysteine-rich CWC family protein [Sunxiuqinia elliptica]TDN99882.1 cysteine-rich CWC protein [Sunxiuqinia elliptica]TDO57074.1 cysteine-rich CWC protein [Sunxiuqinia elliptica]